MSATSKRSDGAPRVLGCSERMGGDAVIGDWRPPTRAEVEALPSLPEPPARPRLSTTVGKARPAKSRSDAGQRNKELPAAPQRVPRPEWIEEGSVRALVWDRPEDTGKLVRSMLMEGAGDEKRSATKAEEVAVLFVALGHEVCGEVMKHLDTYQVEEMTRHVAKVRDVSVEEQRDVLDRFQQQLLAGEWVRQGGIGFARSALEAAGVARRRDILDRVADSRASGLPALRNATPEQVAPFISHEHPQTIALILSQIDAAQAAGILAQLPGRLQADVSYRVATLESVTPAVIKQVEESLAVSLRDILSGDQDVGGPKVVADILNLSGSSVEKNVLDQIDAQDPDISEAVRNRMFVFNDITKLTDRDLQALLEAVDQNDLITSLKAATEEFKQKVHANVSAEAWEELRTKMEAMGPMRLSEVEEAQHRVLQQVRQLEEQGSVTIVRGDADESMV